MQLITQRNIITAYNYFDNFYVCHEMITTHHAMQLQIIYFQNVLTVSYVCPHMPSIQHRILNIRPNRCDNLVAHIGLLVNMFIMI